MENIIPGLYYSKEHEWIKVTEDTATVGITDHAQAAIGDLVYIDFSAAPSNVKSGEAVVLLESVKATSDVYSPVSGEVVELNESLSDAPGSINSDPYGCYLFKIKMSDKTELSSLMDSNSYAEFLAGGDA